MDEGTVASEPTNSGQARPNALLDGLQAVLLAADELLACPSSDAILRRAVELASRVLGLQRCSIWLLDHDARHLMGAYGLNRQGHLTDERTMRYPVEAWCLDVRPGAPRWIKIESAELIEWNGSEFETFGVRSWKAATRVQSTEGPIGIFFNDNGGTGAEFDEGKQNLVAVFCSLLGKILSGKRVEEELRSVTTSARCILWTATVEANEGDFDWKIKIHDDEAALQVLEIDARPGESYYDAWRRSLCRDQLDTMNEVSNRALRTGAPFYSQEIRCSDRQNHLRWLKEDVSLELMSPGHWRACGVCVDITERKETEFALVERAQLAALGADIGSALTRSNTLSHVLQMCAEALVHHVGLSLARIWILDEAENVLLLQASAGDYAPGNARHSRVPVGQWKIGQIADNQRAYVTNDAAADPLIDDKEWIQREGIMAFAGYPLVIDERLVGALAIFSTTPLSKTSFDFLRSLADEIALGIEHKRVEAGLRKAQSRLEERVRERTAEIERVNASLRQQVTDRERAEAELRGSEARYRAIVEDQTELICRYLADGTIVFVNEAYCRYFGRPQAEFIGKTFASLLSDDVWPMIQSHCNSLTLQNPVVSYEHRSVTNGVARWQQWTTRALFDDQNRFIEFQSVARDITARRQAEEAREEAREEAEKANRAKSEFLSRMSHELRTPLNAILGFGQILEMADLKPDEQESVEHIMKGGRHLLDLVNEVLDISRIESGHMEVLPEEFPVSEAVQEIVALARPLTTPRSIRLITNAPPRETVNILADRQRFKQVLLNLISNAIKYNREGGSVTLDCRVIAHDTEQFARIEITDTGKGLTPEEIGKLFTPFERLGAANSTIEGTGIGLALSKSLMQAMGGRIGVESIVNQGSTFWVEMPLAIGSGQQIDDAMQCNGTPDFVETRPKTVLYIEDNPANLRLVERLFHREPSIRLLTATRGRAGVELAYDQVPDLILLDMNLPDMHGKQVLEELLSHPIVGEKPVILVSADGTAQEIRDALAAGASDYLTKPLDIQLFLSTVKAALSGNIAQESVNSSN